MGNKTKRYEIGMIGLGVMGHNFVLNMADKGFSIVGYDKEQDKIEDLRKKTEKLDIYCASNIREFVSLLRRPRAIMMLVPAQGPVDLVIKDLLIYLEPGDLIIDGGNSYFKDTDMRANMLAAQGIQFLGVGISGGEEGARLGPSIMIGGPKEAYERVRQIFESCAAKVNLDPCVAWLGPGSTGHFVKMVHNGIEYGIMQLLAEAYDLMKRGFGLNDDEIYKVYALWNEGELKSYLIDITSKIFSKKDQKTKKLLINEILDVAKQKGTGLWTSQSAMELQVPIPTINLAVEMRDLSSFIEERKLGSRIYQRSVKYFNKDNEIKLSEVQKALYVGIIICYAQGMALLAAASNKYSYHIDLKIVSRIWQGGCVIRAAFLKDVFAAFQNNPKLKNLLLDPNISQKIISNQESLRQVVCKAAMAGIPVPGLMVSLGYLDAYTSAWLPANLIQAQRDYFGAHLYERIDAKGLFHTDWQRNENDKNQ